MLLYMKYQVQNYAIKKHGSLENIQKLKEERSQVLLKRSAKKFKTKLNELRKKTRIDQTCVKNEEKEKHVHEYLLLANGKSKCTICNLEVEIEEF